MQPIGELNLKVGDALDWQVKTPPSVVVRVGKDSVVVRTPELGVVTIEYGEGNWGRVVSDTKSVVGVMINKESGASHKVVNGKALCGAKFTQSSIVTQQGIVTCARCMAKRKDENV